jgi:nitrate reductase gamma subunit
LEGTTHWGKVLLKVTLWGRLVSLCWFMLGFIIYCWSGEVYGVFDVAYMGLFIICDGILSGVLLFMGYGWMINYT